MTVLSVQSTSSYTEQKAAPELRQFGRGFFEIYRRRKNMSVALRVFLFRMNVCQAFPDEQNMR